jgi:hypothetical protein
MSVPDFFSHGDVINVKLRDEAFPFDRTPEEEARHGTLLQGRLVFIDQIGLSVESNGGRCMPFFAEDSSQITDDQLDRGTFFPWHSVISLVKVTDSQQYEAAWAKHEIDAEAFFNANGTAPESNHEFYQWRNSLSNAAYQAAYNARSSDG